MAHTWHQARLKPARVAPLHAAWEEVVEPAARRFGPDIILVSAGYDAHWADPLAGLQARRGPAHLPAAAHSWAGCRQAGCCRTACCSPPHPALAALLAAAQPALSGPVPVPAPCPLQYRSSTFHALAARLKALADKLCGGRLVFTLGEGRHWSSRQASVLVGSAGTIVS